MNESEEFLAWDMRLAACGAGEGQHLLRLLTGALASCGAWVLSRAVSGTEAAEITFEFARACCIDIYAVLVASGIELSGESHLHLTELCACTRNLMGTKAFDVARVRLIVYLTDAPIEDSPACENARGIVS